MNNDPYSSTVRKAGLLLLCAAAPLILGACGEPSKSKPKAGPPAAEPFTGQVHEVKMRGTAAGYFYEPEQLVIKSGDKVRFVMVDGGPHNVTFANQKIPGGATAILEREGLLVGVMLQAPGQATEIHFVKALPPGTYNFVCDPHAALGMTGKIVVTP